MQLIKSLLRFALCLTILFFVFRWIDFSIWQSLTLTVLGGIAYLAYENATYKKPPFTPYCVIISPKFHTLLLDYKLLKNVEEYDQLFTMWRQKKDQKLIAFTVLQGQANGDSLVYSNAHHHFQSGENFDEPIQALVFKSTRDEEREDLYLRDPTLRDDDSLISPSICLKYGRLGIEVRQHWWDKICAENPTTELIKTKVDSNLITGSAWLTIATIPLIAFSIFRARGNYEQINKLWVEIDKALALEGWERQKPDPNAEVRDPWIRIEHKYFSVEYVDL